ncbi:uncharacterized protein [Diadema antillarum]|uniref:uncharacterized protein n=1 Tax=Diadema antillarum TaxID=105358 RepID=UPI003A87B992
MSFQKESKKTRKRTGKFGKVGKVSPLNTTTEQNMETKPSSGNGNGTDVDVENGFTNLLTEDPSRASSDGGDKFKDVKRNKRLSTAGGTDVGIDANIISGPKNPNVANAELIGYFGHLAISADPNIAIDLEYLELILRRGADINCTDSYGQTVLHEVARTWDPDVAVFLIDRGSRVDQADSYGRTPLHVAATVNFPGMVENLLDRGADIEYATKGENQTPLHYAARNDACKTLRSLVKRGASLQARDYKGRTPLQVAAEYDRSETARLLLESGGTASDTDDSGHSAMQFMVTKMPHVAMTALNQFYNCDRPSRKQYFDLHLLEPLKKKSNRNVYARTVLQSIVDFNQLELIVHPVIRKLVEVKWTRFGRFGAYKQLAFNLLFILMWTVLALSLDTPFRFVLPADIWRLVLEISGVLLTLFQIFQELKEFFDSKAIFLKWKKWRMSDIKRDYEYAHPRWPQEKQYLDQEIAAIKDKSPSYFADAWNGFDWFVYLSLLCVSILHVVDIFIDLDRLSQATFELFSIVIILVWIRLMKSVRAFRSLGPFIVMLGLVLNDFGVFIFLYANFYIPYACAFWMNFGGVRVANGTIASMATVDQMMYSLFRITLVDEYEFDLMREENAIMAYILLVSFLTISAVLCLNVLIAMLSNTFQRIYDNATAIALIQQAKITLAIEDGLFERTRKKYDKYIREHCSPLSVYYDDDVVTEEGEDLKKATFHIQNSLMELEEFLQDQKNPAQMQGIARLSRKVDILTERNNVMFAKMQADMETMQELLKNLVAQQQQGRGGGGDGGGGRGRGRGGLNDGSYDDGGGDDRRRGQKGGEGGEERGGTRRGRRRQDRRSDDDDGSDVRRRGRQRRKKKDHEELSRSNYTDRAEQQSDTRSRTLHLSKNSTWDIEIDDDNEPTVTSPRFLPKHTTGRRSSLFDNAMEFQRLGPGSLLPPITATMEGGGDAAQRARLLRSDSKMERKLRRQREEYLQQKLNSSLNATETSFVDVPRPKDEPLADIIRMRQSALRD